MAPHLSAIITAGIIGAFATIFFRGMFHGIGVHRWGRAVTRVVSRVVSPELARALFEMAGGLAGIVCVILWIAFRMNDRVYNWWSPEPDIASLEYADLRSTHYIFNDTSANVDIQVTLRNGNNFTIEINGTVAAAANGVRSHGVPIYAIVRANEKHIFAASLSDIPWERTLPSMKGEFDYDLSYRALGGTRHCYTKKALLYDDYGVQGTSPVAPIHFQRESDRCD